MKRRTAAATGIQRGIDRLGAKGGFNLVELLVAIVVLSVVVAMMASIFLIIASDLVFTVIFYVLG